MAFIHFGRKQYFYRQVRGRFFFALATHRQQTQIVRMLSVTGLQLSFARSTHVSMQVQLSVTWDNFRLKLCAVL